MNIIFCYLDSGHYLFKMNSNDVAGVIAAAKGKKIVFDRKHYRYNHHVLNHYVENGVHHQDLLIYVEEY
jgi:hypothetical protein